MAQQVFALGRFARLSVIGLFGCFLQGVGDEPAFDADVGRLVAGRIAWVGAGLLRALGLGRGGLLSLAP